MLFFGTNGLSLIRLEGFSLGGDIEDDIGEGVGEDVGRGESWASSASLV